MRLLNSSLCSKKPVMRRRVALKFSRTDIDIRDRGGMTAQSNTAEVQTIEPEAEAHRKPPRGKVKKSRYVWLSFLCGAALAVLFMELVLHNFSGKSENSEGFE